jgi:hypothetical protein
VLARWGGKVERCQIFDRQPCVGHPKFVTRGNSAARDSRYETCGLLREPGNIAPQAHSGSSIVRKPSRACGLAERIQPPVTCQSVACSGCVRSTLHDGVAHIPKVIIFGSGPSTRMKCERI